MWAACFLKEKNTVSMCREIQEMKNLKQTQISLLYYRLAFVKSLAALFFIQTRYPVNTAIRFDRLYTARVFNPVFF